MTTNYTIPALCVARPVARQPMFLRSVTPISRTWTRHPSRARQFDSWKDAEKAAQQIPGARVQVAPLLTQIEDSERVKRLEAIARVASDLHFEAVQHDAATFRVSRRTLYELENALAMYHAEEPQ